MIRPRHAPLLRIGRRPDRPLNEFPWTFHSPFVPSESAICMATCSGSDLPVGTMAKCVASQQSHSFSKILIRLRSFDSKSREGVVEAAPLPPLDSPLISEFGHKRPGVSPAVSDIHACKYSGWWLRQIQEFLSLSGDHFLHSRPGCLNIFHHACFLPSFCFRPHGYRSACCRSRSHHQCRRRCWWKWICPWNHSFDPSRWHNKEPL